MGSLGKTALVTGGGSGIGKAVAIALAHDGFSVVVAGRHVETLQATVAEGLTLGALITAIPADVRDESAVKALFVELKGAFGRLDLLFNNAGLGYPNIPLEDLTFEQWKSVIETSLYGSFLCTREAIRLMKSQDPRGGRIINNGSMSAHSPRPNSAPYTAAKHAILGFTKSIALDGREFNIACGQIDIGNAATGMIQTIANSTRQSDEGVGREPTINLQHVARAVVYMASLPLEANVLSMSVMPTKMPFVGRG